MVQEEHKASLMLVLVPAITIELRLEIVSPDDQPITVMVESSQAAMAWSARKILKPYIVVQPPQEVCRAVLEPNANLEVVMIIF
jgi:hypothetical protein